MERAPIFVAGPDRSGTSLMFAFLASHPNISMVRRTNMWRYFHGRYGDLAQPANFERCLDDMARYNRMRHLLPDRARIRAEFALGEPSYGRLFALFHAHHAERRGKSRWGDKSLHTEHYADQVFQEFPAARIIHMVRDPRDRYASVRKRFGRDVARVGAATARWLFSIRVARRNLRRYPENYLIVRFEDLARNPEETMRQVCAFIGEAYTPAMLTMEGAPEHKGGNSSFGKLEPGVITTSPIGRFRTVLAGPEIEFIQLWTGPDMLALGYQPEPVQMPTTRRLAFFLADLPLNVGRMLGWLGVSATAMRRGIRVPAGRLLDLPAGAGGD
jgi:Sulfotransferase family